MTEQLKKIIGEELPKLLEEEQVAINSIDWVMMSEKIGLKYSLTETQINKIQTEVLLVLLRMEYLSDLKINIEQNAETSKLISEKIGNELIELVFRPITKKLKDIVKNSPKYINVSWDKSVNFIISGGDYTVFLDK